MNRLNGARATRLASPVHDAALRVRPARSVARGGSAKAGATLPPTVMAALLDHIEVGMLVCDAEGRLLHANGEGWAELERAEMLAAVEGKEGGGRLVHAAGSPADDDALQAAIHGAAFLARRRMVALRFIDQHMLVTAVPLAGDAAEPLVLLMLGRRNLCSQIGLDMLAITHGLTPAEGRVMGGLLAGLSATQIASESGVCISTVRTQICAIRDKLGVSSMRQLLLRAACVPPAASALQRGAPWRAAA